VIEFFSKQKVHKLFELFFLIHIGVPLNSPQYETMQNDIMRITSGKTIVGHNVNADIQQIGKTRGDFTGVIDTQNMGSISHSSNRSHNPAEDARQAMNLANRKLF